MTQYPFSEEPEERSVVRRAGTALTSPTAETADTTGARDTSNDGLLGYWQILRQSKGTLVIFGFVGAVAGILFSLPQTPIYRARTSLELQSFNDNYLNLRGVDPIAVNYGADTYMQTQIQILQSDTLLTRVVTKLKEQMPSDDRVVPTSRLRSWLTVAGLPAPPMIPARDKSLHEAARSVTVSGSGLTRIVQVFSESPNPELAAGFVNTLAAEYIDQNLEARWNATQHTGDWLMRQLKDLQSKLEKSEEELHSYAAASGLMFMHSKENVSELKLKQIQEELSRAQAERVVKQSRYEQASNSPPESLPEVLDDGSLRNYQVKLADLRRELAELRAVLTNEHPKVERVEAQLEEMRETLVKERAHILRRIKNEYESAARREALLEKVHATQAKVVGVQSEKAIHYNILQREVETTRQLYEALLQKMKEAGIASAMSVSNIRVVDPAKPPDKPYKPNWRLNALMGLFSGGFLGLVFVSVRHRADRRLREPGDVMLYMKLPELGVIPSAKADPSTAAMFKKQGALNMLIRSKTSGNDAEGETEELDERLELIVAQRPLSLMAEAYRATLTSILFSETGRRKRVIAVSSPSPGEGKTTTISNIGVALADIGQRVLLVDADVRKPRLHGIFNVSNTIGLSNLLKDKQLIADAPLETLIRPTSTQGLYLLPSGSGAANAANLLYSPRLALILQRFRSEFDVILIDTPPTLHMFDARVVGRLADAVILVFRLGHTTKDTALAAMRRLSEDGTFLLGTIVNDWNPKQSNGYGYDGYYRSYGYSNKPV